VHYHADTPTAPHHTAAPSAAAAAAAAAELLHLLRLYPLPAQHLLEGLPAALQLAMVLARPAAAAAAWLLVLLPLLLLAVCSRA
jgi:hypothetical protein